MAEPTYTPDPADPVWRQAGKAAAAVVYGDGMGGGDILIEAIAAALPVLDAAGRLLPAGGQWDWAIRFNSLRGPSSIMPRDDEEHARLFFAEPSGTENAELVRRWVGPWQPVPTERGEASRG